ncbi:TetR/AcrR family transcriptional regulator [Candidatus Contubernalis alkaliaceticus]|uniref:TetR/AcrR family transcriptional regulator n=1 Tax=Candidatus Contubernalis alkaliaceticus TaxID=338645 RepID=UPI001F4BD44E|nr:TetR/AcrR family transcriptional regulator [Candidatus Contubernalis alkalaceticus]UNC93300.1 TetR/AcrR family transcriptional regulator [Candidatus Contubernalis alkalaceticus]
MHDSGRKQEFLAAALELFYEKGYDKTTVNDIVGRLNASKGAFYHYFKSKEDILREVVFCHIEEEITLSRKIAHNNQLSAGEKLTKIFNEVLMHQDSNIEKRKKLFIVFKDEGNVKFRRKIVENKIKMLRQPYKIIIQQGIKEGIFDTCYPEEAAEQIINLLIILKMSVVGLSYNVEKNLDNIDIVNRKIEAYREAVERILGAKGSLINTTQVAEYFKDQSMQNNSQ